MSKRRIADEVCPESTIPKINSYPAKQYIYVRLRNFEELGTMALTQHSAGVYNI